MTTAGRYVLHIFDEHTGPSELGSVHRVYVCPGCGRWQVEMISPTAAPHLDSATAFYMALEAADEAFALKMGASEVATAHRADAPP